MTNKDLVAFCLKAKDKPIMYMWGDYGRPITEKTIAAKAKQYPSHYRSPIKMSCALRLTKAASAATARG